MPIRQTQVSQLRPKVFITFCWHFFMLPFTFALLGSTLKSPPYRLLGGYCDFGHNVGWEQPNKSQHSSRKFSDRILKSLFICRPMLSFILTLPSKLTKIKAFENQTKAWACSVQSHSLTWPLWMHSSVFLHYLSMVTWVRFEEGDRDPKYLAADGRHSSAEFNIRNRRKKSHEFEREKAGWRTYIGGVGGRKGMVGSDIIINSEDKIIF